MSKAEDLVIKSQALPLEYRLTSNDLDLAISRSVESWKTPTAKLSRKLRVRPTFVARLAAEIGTHFDGENLDRYLPPTPWLQVDSLTLQEPAKRALFEGLVSLWISIQEDIALSSGAMAEYQTFVSEFIDGEWTRWLNPSDYETVRGASNFKFLDLSTSQALSEILLPTLTPHDALVTYAGLLAGSMSQPRTSAEWDLASGWATSTNRRLETSEHFYSARAWLHSNFSHFHSRLSSDSYQALLGWFYGRAANFPSFSSIDLQIHEDRKNNPAKYEGGSVFPDAVVQAITNKRIGAIGQLRVQQFVEKDTASFLAELNTLEGLEEVKSEIHNIVDLIHFEKDRASQGMVADIPELHMIFTGNPGTGKTTVARLYGQILKSLKVLGGSNFVEITGTELLQPFHGGSGAKVRDLVKRAEGGVLFIDEAYSIAAGQGGIANEIIAELLSATENNRGKLVIILAGYASPMGKFIDVNEGLRSRFRNPLLFKDMGTTQLHSAILGLIAGSEYQISVEAVERLHAYISQMPRGEGFGNVREMRKLFANIRENIARRYASDKSVSVNAITEADIPTLSPGKIDEVRYVSAVSNLQAMIGLDAVKQAVNEVASQAIVRQKLAETDRDIEPFAVGHFSFVGNPGTGKTTVAHQLGEIFQSVGVLRNSNVVVKNRSTLVGQYVGQTGPLVRAAVQQALDGILFIDEAYALVPKDSHRDFGPEAVATLIEEMEKYRRRLVVILAGYPKEMETFLSSNPGLRSRVNHRIEFADYSKDELKKIARYVAQSEPFIFDDEVLELIATRSDSERDKKDFANARTVRNYVEATVSKFSLRAAVSPEVLMSRKISLEDVPDAGGLSQVQFGFA
jgi:SpoVK/Ycf46/Vps4 family AAA+-type ATPase